MGPQMAKKDLESHLIQKVLAKVTLRIVNSKLPVIKVFAGSLLQ